MHTPSLELRLFPPSILPIPPKPVAAGPAPAPNAATPADHYVPGPIVVPAYEWKTPQPDPLIKDVKNNQVFTLSNGTKVKLPFVAEGSKGVSILGAVDVNALNAMLPPNLETVPAPQVENYKALLGVAAISPRISMKQLKHSGIAVLTMARYDASPVGPIDHAYIGAFVRDKNDPKHTPRFIFFEYMVDHHDAKLAGEELWGMPKMEGTPDFWSDKKRDGFKYSYGGQTELDIRIQKSHWMVPYTTAGNIDCYTTGVPGISGTLNTLQDKYQGKLGLFKKTDVLTTGGAVKTRLDAMHFNPFAVMTLTKLVANYGTDTSQLKNPAVVTLRPDQQKP